MTETFMEAIERLNSIALSLRDMEEDEAKMVAMLICDLGTFLTTDDIEEYPLPVWQARPMRVPVQ